MQSLGLRKVLANKDILEPVVEQTISLVHEEEFNSLAKELGFLKESCSDGKTECVTPPKVIFVGDKPVLPIRKAKLMAHLQFLQVAA